jgi:tetratricopeptide (TPR) repeat protein
MKSSSSRRALAAIVVVTTAFGTGVSPRRARAQPSAEDDQKARELFRMGESHYIAGRYEKAAVLYEEAYRLSGRLELLIAMANTYERMGEYAQAIDHLRQYLKSPKAKNVGAVRDRLQRLETSQRDREAERERLRRLELQEQERAKERRQRQQTDDQRARALTSDGRSGAQVTARKGPSRLPAYLFLAGGAVGVGGAVGFGIAARRAHQDGADLCADNQLCPTSARRAIDREKRWSILADVSAVVGASSAAVGLVLWWTRRGVDTRENRHALRLDGTLLPGGGTVGVTADF